MSEVTAEKFTPETGSRPGLVFSTDRELTPDQLKKNYADIKGMHLDSQKFGTPIVLHGGWKVQVINSTRKETTPPYPDDFAGFDHWSRTALWCSLIGLALSIAGFSAAALYLVLCNEH